MTRKRPLVDLPVALVAETGKAWKVEAGTGVIAWVPKALAEYDPDTHTLTLPEWLAIERGLV